MTISDTNKEAHTKLEKRKTGEGRKKDLPWVIQGPRSAPWCLLLSLRVFRCQKREGIKSKGGEPKEDMKI